MAGPTLLVLAAGMGSRFGGIKQLEGLGPSDEVILEYSIYDAKNAGFERVVLILREEIVDDFNARVGKRLAEVIPVDVVLQDPNDLPAGFTLPPERTKPWGTAHAILAARNAIDTPFAALNADDFYGKPAFETMAKKLALSKSASENGGVAQFLLAGYPLQNTLSEHGSVARGICVCNAAGQLLEIAETQGIEWDPNNSGRCRYPDVKKAGEFCSPPTDAMASMNFWGLTPCFFDIAERQFAEFLATEAKDDLKAEFYIPTVVSNEMAAGKAQVEVLVCDSPWYGVTYREDAPYVKEAFAKMVEDGTYPTPLW